MILRIDTHNMEEVIVSLASDSGETIAIHKAYNKYGSQVLLPAIKSLLKEHKKELRDLTGIEVNTGPGSYTGLRVGVAVANVLGFVLGIKVNKKTCETKIQYI